MKSKISGFSAPDELMPQDYFKNLQYQKGFAGAKIIFFLFKPNFLIC